MFTVADGVVTLTAIGTVVITTMPAVIIDMTTGMIVIEVTISHQETIDTISQTVMIIEAGATGIVNHSQIVMITRAEAIGIINHSQTVMITRAEAIGVAIGHNLHSQAKTGDKTKTVMAGIEVRHNRQTMEEAGIGVTMAAVVSSLKLKTQGKAALPVQGYKAISLTIYSSKAFREIGRLLFFNSCLL
jgi:hypothetical protein